MTSSTVKSKSQSSIHNNNQIKKDPKVRRDGMCYTCKGPRPEVAIKEHDPFCKSDCCREYYGIEIRKNAGTGDQNKALYSSGKKPQVKGKK